MSSATLQFVEAHREVAEYLHRTLGERFAPPQLLRDKVAAGDPGRKTGRGFHTYEPAPSD